MDTLIAKKPKARTGINIGWDGGIFGSGDVLNGHVQHTWPIFRPNERVNGRIVFFATHWQVREGHI